MKSVLYAALLGAGLHPIAGLRANPATAGSAPIVLVQMSDDEDAGAPADPRSSVAAMTVRVDRLENTIRALTGQVEELQFQNKKLADDLRKVQQDVDFRFQDLNRGAAPGVVPAKPAKRSDLDAPAGADGLPADASGVIPAPAGAPPPTSVPRRVGDAFDPTANPTAPGAPRPLGSTAPSSPLTPSRQADKGVTLNNAPGTPMDLMRHSTTPSIIDDQSTENGVAAISPSGTPDTTLPPRPAAASPNVVASLVPGGTRDEYNADVELYKAGQYDGAATGLKTFLDKYPRDRMVPDAVYLLGETYTKLGRHREAAEQFLRLSTDFSKAPRAPDSLLRLGMSLNAMGVREQACATYQEVGRRYPAATPDVKASVDRELKRARC